MKRCLPFFLKQPATQTWTNWVKNWTTTLENWWKKFCVMRKSRHQWNLPLWNSSKTSNLFKSLETKERLLLDTPTLYMKPNFDNQRSNVTGCTESAYQLNLWEQRNTHLIFKHIKKLIEIFNLPKILINDGVSSRSTVEKINMLNH